MTEIVPTNPIVKRTHYIVVCTTNQNLSWFAFQDHEKMYRFCTKGTSYAEKGHRIYDMLSYESKKRVPLAKKNNYVVNNAQDLTKFTTHYLDTFQIKV